MAHDEEAVVAEEQPPARLPKFTLVIIALSVLLGVLLATIVVGGMSYVKKTRTLQAEVVAVKKDLQEKARLHENQQEQIEALSQQISALKEYSVARSGAGRGKEVKNGVPLPSVSEASGGAVNSNEKAPTSAKEVKTEPMAPAQPPVPPIPPKIKRASPEGQSCDLVGKSPEEQSLILKRCVGVMDSPPKGKAAAK